MYFYHEYRISKLAPHLVHLPSANCIIRSNELVRLGQGIIILQFEVHFDIYGATLVNHDKPVTVFGGSVFEKKISEYVTSKRI
jgi:hypothetical protein